MSDYEYLPIADKIKATWEHIAKNWPEKWIKESVNEWKKLLELQKEHKDCKKEVECWDKSCGYKCCIHLKGWISHQFCLCVMCDNMSQPFISNPANRAYVLLYLPHFKHLIE